MLHGDIKVNNQVIATWSAINRSRPGTPDDQPHVYWCEVVYEDGREWHGRIRHVRNEGATALIAQLMKRADKRTRPE